MTLELCLSIVGAVGVFVLMRFVMKKPWLSSLLTGAAVLFACNIQWFKPSLEIVGQIVSGRLVLIAAGFVMLVLIVMKVPVFLAVFAGAVIYYLMFTEGISQFIFARKGVGAMDSTSLLAIPFFVGTGVLMKYSGGIRHIMSFCVAVTGRMSGGLAQANVLLSALTGGLSCSDTLQADTQARLLAPEMEKQGYSREFSSVLTAASAMITPLIPPGIAMILYSSVADVSISKLFISGIVVGGLLCVAMMALVYLISRKRGYAPARAGRMAGGEFRKCLLQALPVFCLPVILLAGICLGVITVTEAGALAILAALVLGLIWRELTWASVLRACKETVVITAGIMLIVSAASVFSWVLTKERVPQQLTALIMRYCPNRYIFLIGVNILVLFAGMFVDSSAVMVVLVPLLAPVAAQYGINGVHFAMVYIFGSAIGALTPPTAPVMSAACSITGCKTRHLIKEAWPFYILLLILLILFTFVPSLTAGIVGLVYGTT